MRGTKKLLKSYKTEINPTFEQKQIINRTIGVCRFIYNFYLAHNREIYESEKRFVSGMDFSKWLNNEFLSNNSEFSWIKDVSSKSVKQSIMNAEKAFKNFFKGKSKFPKFKKKNKSDVKMYFVKTDAKTIISCERHRIKIPTLGWVQLKEKGYIPTNPDTHIIKSGAISCKARKYYVSVLVEQEETIKPQLNDFGIGIDLGIKDLVIDSNGIKYENPKYLNKVEKKIKHLQRLYSKKTKDSNNQEKARIKLAAAHEKLSNKRKDNLHKLTNKLIKENDIICIENLNVKGMTKNHRLAKAIQDASFGTLVSMLKYKAAWHNRQIIEVGRYYPSSKICHCCGHKMDYMELEVRNWTCPVCHSEHDRDINAAINIMNEGLRLLDNIGQELPNSKPAEIPTMDDKLAITLKSSGLKKHENAKKQEDSGF